MPAPSSIVTEGVRKTQQKEVCEHQAGTNGTTTCRLRAALSFAADLPNVDLR
jgi:hypothetical protein